MGFGSVTDVLDWEMKQINTVIDIVNSKEIDNLLKMYKEVGGCLRG